MKDKDYEQMASKIMINALKGVKAQIHKAYNKGLNEAWEVARKLCQSVKYGGLAEHCSEIFKRTPFEMFDVFDYTAQEAMEKVKEYEKKHEVRETDSERKPPKADCDKCMQKGVCGHPESVKKVVRENGCYGFIPDYQ